MKRLFVLSILVIFVLSLTGCGAPKLKEGQSYVELKKGGSAVLAMYMSDKDADEAFDIDTDDSTRNIKEDLTDYFKDSDIDVKINKIKANKDSLRLTITVDDYEDMFYADLDMTLEDYAEENFYDDFDDFADAFEFVLFKNENDVKSKNLEDYEDYAVLTVFGGEEGAYYKVPGKIAIVSDKMDFKKEGSSSIFIESDETGIIVYKK